MFIHFSKDFHILCEVYFICWYLTQYIGQSFILDAIRRTKVMVSANNLFDWVIFIEATYAESSKMQF